MVYGQRKAGRSGVAVLLGLRRRAETRRVYEVEIGSTLGELIDLAGGVRDGLPLKAVAPSGPSGGFIPAVLSEGGRAVPGSTATSRPDATSIDIRELPLDIDEFRTLESDARRRTDRVCAWPRA